MNKLYVIGIGYKPLDKKEKEIIYKSEIILASNRLFEIFKEYEELERVKDKIKVINNVDETINFIRAEVQKSRSAEVQNLRVSELPSFRAIVLLASGDPTFFGIGRRTVREFGKDMVEIIPDLSCIQLAFSRIKESWDDAFLMSLHGGPDPEKRRRLPYEINDIPSLFQRYNKIAILTDKENNPAKIAKVLLESSALLRYCSSAVKVYVCEKLGYRDERIIEGTPEEIAAMQFADPNVVIIQQSEQIPPIPPFLKGGEGGFLEIKFGLTEKEITHSRGLITKDEVRAVTIHKLRLPQRGVFWDIGAGSGSISTEAARLYPELKVFAIERDEEQINNIKENKIRFNVPNMEIIKGEATAALMNLPHPDRVFIGGSGGKLKEIIDFVAQMPAKIIVINAITIETLNGAVKCLENKSFEIEISEVSVSRLKAVSGKRHMSALNPVFIITGEKSI